MDTVAVASLRRKTGIFERLLRERRSDDRISGNTNESRITDPATRCNYGRDDKRSNERNDLVVNNEQVNENCKPRKQKRSLVGSSRLVPATWLV